MDYTAFGTPYGHGDFSGPHLNIGRAGREYDGDTCLYYNRARWYDPKIHRFISEDPIGFAAGDANLYRYCGNSPTNFTDPSGQFVFGGLGIALGITIAGLLTANVAYRVEANYYDAASDAAAQGDWQAFDDYVETAQYAGATGNIAVVAAVAAPAGWAAGFGMGVAASFGAAGTAFGLGFSTPFMVAGGMEAYDMFGNLGQMSGVQRYEALGSLGAGLLAGGVGSATGFGAGRGATSAWLLSGSRANWLLSAGRGTMRSSILRSNLKYAYNTGAFFAGEATSIRGLTRPAPGEVSAPEATTGRQFWIRSTEFQGNKVFQRDDLFDPNLMTSWKVKGQVVQGTNLERMATGRAPIGYDSQAVNLHHLIQTQDSAIAEVTGTMHQTNYGVLHINAGELPSGINRSIFGNWRESYWMNRVNDFQ